VTSQIHMQLQLQPQRRLRGRFLHITGMPTTPSPSLSAIQGGSLFVRI
jgi:hypothetical protein